MKNPPVIVVLLLGLILGAGCAGSNWGWATRDYHAGGTPYTAKNGGFTVCFPKGWVSDERTPDRVLGIMSNEIEQRIIVKYTALNEPLPYTQQYLTPNLNAAELASALIEDLRRCTTTRDLTVLERGPAVIDGSPGCKVTAQFRNDEIGGLEMKKMFYATIRDDRLYMLLYDAKTGAPYEAGLPGFEAVVKSFRFGAPP